MPAIAIAMIIVSNGTLSKFALGLLELVNDIVFITTIGINIYDFVYATYYDERVDAMMSFVSNVAIYAISKFVGKTYSNEAEGAYASSVLELVHNFSYMIADVVCTEVSGYLGE